MRKAKKIFVVVLSFLCIILAASVFVNLANIGNDSPKKDSSSSILTEPVFDPYEGVSGNRTILNYDVAEDNLTVSFKVGAEVERVVFSSGNEEYIYEAHQDVAAAGTIEYTFETPGGKQVEIFGATSFVDNAFFDEKRLTYVSFGEGVVNVGKYAFHGCRAMRNVFFSETLKSIGYGAFMYVGVSVVDIPDTLTTLGELSFFQCPNITTISIGAGVTEIPDKAFLNCLKVSSLTIGENVQKIGYQAFEASKGLTELVIPDSVKTIGGSAFANCDSITKLTIGSSVESIGTNAFSSLIKLQNVICRAENPPSVDYGTFNAWQSIETISVPNETAKTAYQAANGWNEFADKIFVG